MRAGPAGNDRDVDDVEKPKIINVGKENAAQDGRGENAGKKMRENDLLLRTTGISRNPGPRSK